MLSSKLEDCVDDMEKEAFCVLNVPTIDKRIWIGEG